MTLKSNYKNGVNIYIAHLHHCSLSCIDLILFFFSGNMRCIWWQIAFDTFHPYCLSQLAIGRRQACVNQPELCAKTHGFQSYSAHQLLGNDSPPSSLLIHNISLFISDYFDLLIQINYSHPLQYCALDLSTTNLNLRQ